MIDTKRESMRSRLLRLEPAPPIHTLFGFRGRLSRKTFWVAMSFPASLLVIAASSERLGVPWPARLVLQLVALSAAAAIHVKRWHDLGKPGSRCLLALVPWVGWWAWVELGFVPSEVAPNGRRSEAITSRSVRSWLRDAIVSGLRDAIYLLAGPLTVIAISIYFENTLGADLDYPVESLRGTSDWTFWKLVLLAPGAISLAHRGHAWLAWSGLGIFSLIATSDFTAEVLPLLAASTK